MAGQKAKVVKDGYGNEYMIEKGFKRGDVRSNRQYSKIKSKGRYISFVFGGFDEHCNVMLRRDNYKRNGMYKIIIERLD